MSSRVPCAECGQWMSDQAAVCPHCNARQPDRDPIDHERVAARAAEDGLLTAVAGKPPPRADGDLAVDKARGLLALHDAVHVTRVPTTLGELFEYAVMPRTRGLSRVVEVVLTVAALPLLLLALIAAKRWSRRFTIELSLGNMMLAAPVAGVALYAFARGGGLSNGWALGLAAGMSLSWILREALRWRSSS